MSDKKPGWSFSFKDDGNAYPEDFADLVWDWGQSTIGRIGIRPRSRKVLGTLVNEAFAASLQSEEGRPVRLQLLFNPPARQVTVTFDKPLPYSASNLVKLAPTIDLGFRWIVVAPEQPGQDELKIIGFCDLELSQLANKPMRTVGGGLMSHQPNTEGMKLSVFGPGSMRIETAMTSFELRNCSIRIPCSVGRIKYVKEWYKEAGQGLDFSQLPVGSDAGQDASETDYRRIAAGQLVGRTWTKILSKVCNARHGGTFLIVPKPAEVSNHVRFNYPLHSDQLRAAIQKRAGYEPGLSNPHYRSSMAGSDVDEAHFAERDLARTADLVASLAAVDGAVVLDRKLTLLGFGAEILDTGIPDPNEFVTFGAQTTGRPERKSLTTFGMRHRSAYRFCQDVEGSIAFVVSQDGGLRVFCNTGGKDPRAFEELTPEDWIDSGITVRSHDERDQEAT